MFLEMFCVLGYFIEIIFESYNSENLRRGFAQSMKASYDIAARGYLFISNLLSTPLYFRSRIRASARYKSGRLNYKGSLKRIISEPGPAGNCDVSIKEAPHPQVEREAAKAKALQCQIHCNFWQLTGLYDHPMTRQKAADLVAAASPGRELVTGRGGGGSGGR